MRTLVVIVTDSLAALVDRYARARGKTSEAAAADLIENAANSSGDIVLRIRDVEDALERRRKKEQHA